MRLFLSEQEENEKEKRNEKGGKQACQLRIQLTKMRLFLSEFFFFFG